MKNPSTPRLNTIGQIAVNLGVPIHRVRYVIGTRTHIQHCALAGKARLFDRLAVSQIRHELNAIDARGAGGGK